MTFLFCCTRLSGYFYNCIKTLAEADPAYRIVVIAYPPAANAPFQFGRHNQIKILSRTELESDSKLKEVLNSTPNFVYLAGWRDKRYRQIARRFNKVVPVVMGMDNQWKSNLRQHFFMVLNPLFLKSICQYLWVPGPRQFSFAQRLGFGHREIMTGLYSADTLKFLPTESEVQAGARKHLVFVGNMWPDKGVLELVQAYQELRDEFETWTLDLVGSGPLVDELRDIGDRVKVFGFLQPQETKKVLEKASAFCLPSHHDAWGVVLHEAVCMGLPIVATDVCGAVDAFLIEGYNGFACAPQNRHSLKNSLRKLFSLSDSELGDFGSRSFMLSQQLSPQIWVLKVLGLVS